MGEMYFLFGLCIVGCVLVGLVAMLGGGDGGSQITQERMARRNAATGGAGNSGNSGNPGDSGGPAGDAAPASTGAPAAQDDSGQGRLAA